MKKLALALMCLVSVAFFASCNKPVANPEPSIAAKTGENYVYDGQTVDLGQNYTLGFVAASNSQTKKELATFKLNVKFTTLDDTETRSYDSIINVSGTEYTFEQVLNFGLTNEESRELVAKAVFTAIITDVAGETATTSIKLSINQPAQPLVVNDFSWNRHGAAAVTGGIEEVGLSWTSNGKEDFAILKPVEGATLYGFDPEEWGKATTDVEKAALFTEGVHSVMSEFRGVSAWSSKDYNFVIGTVYNGKFNLIHITRGEVSTFKGTDVTIIGQIK